MTTTTFAPPAPTVLRVRPHEVERGDVLVGSTRPVETLLFHGADWCWCAYDAQGIQIRRLLPGLDVQVIRGRAVDDCPPHGIVRPLRLVPS